MRDEEACGLALACWRDLDSCRPQGFSGAGAIPYTAILEWSRHNSIDSENVDMLITVIRHLDIDRADRIAAASKGA